MNGESMAPPAPCAKRNRGPPEGPSTITSGNDVMASPATACSSQLRDAPDPLPRLGVWRFPRPTGLPFVENGVASVHGDAPPFLCAACVLPARAPAAFSVQRQFRSEVFLRGL